ncbi:MAG: response regulator [Magnetococcales bacterium]|nr:response regulator [Magnetococcales bacterium]
MTHKPAILIVDDSPENLDTLKHVLINSYKVRPAINGPLALRLANMEPQPDLILLDIMMPEMDGLEVCRRLKQDVATQDIPVIFVTAKTASSDELAGLQAGAVDFITKPINPPIVMARIKTQLTLRYFNREMEEKNYRLNEINERLSDSMELLSASEERFRSLVQTIPDIVYKIDAEGKFTFLNKSIERLGYHQSDLIGKHFSEIILEADVKTSSLDQVIETIGRGTIKPEQKVFDERRTGLRMTVGLEIRLKTKTGQAAELAEIKNLDTTPIKVEVNSTGLYGDVGSDTSYRTRQYVGTVGVIRDITDRHKAQMELQGERKLLRRLIDAVPMPIFFCDGGEHLTFSNKASRVFSPDKAHLPTSTQGLADLFGKENARALHALFEKLLTTPDLPHLREETLLRTSDGMERTVDVILNKFQKADLNGVAIIGVLVDITEQKTFTEELIEARRQAEEMARKAEKASQAKGDFLANMSHEIRTPLNAIINLTHLVLQTALQSKQQDYLIKVESAGNTLLGLINDILDVSKIEADGIELENSPFNLEEVLENLANIINIKSDQKPIEILYDIDAAIPRELSGDAMRLGQVLLNLMTNAIKFTPKGMIILQATLKRHQVPFVDIEFSVQDQGIGIPKDKMDRLFAPFSQVDGSTTRTYGGTGLGLTICKRLVEMMGGKISLKSQEGEGSTFHFWVRLELNDQERRQQIRAPQALLGMHVLIVDDSAVALHVLANICQGLGMHVETAESAETAQRLIQNARQEERHYALIMVDWQLPGMDGAELADAIKERAKDDKHPPKTILITAHDVEHLGDLGQYPSLDAFLFKPITPSMLLETILNVLSFHDRRGVAHRPSRGMIAPEDRLQIKGSILLVEDNEINQEIAIELLEQTGLQVTVAENGQQALDILDAESFDLVFMDIQMPVMNGLEATRHIRKMSGCQDLPIVAMTANAMASDRKKSLEAGMDDHISKPVVPNELIAVVKHWVKRHDQTPRLSEPTPAPPAVNASLHIPGINVIQGLRNVGGNTTLYRKVLLKFSKNQGDACTHMQEHLAANDAKALEETAHALKGVAATIGAQQLSEQAAVIESSSHNADRKDTLAPIIAALSTALTQVIDAIADAFPEAAAESLSLTPSDPDEETVGVESLTPLFTESARLLHVYDSAIEEVVAQLAALRHDANGKEHLAAMQQALDAYDFEKALQILTNWADALQISLDG